MYPTRDDIRFLPETHTYLSTRSINTLLRNGYQTTKQLLAANAEQLITMKGFGFQGLEEVAEWREAVTAMDRTAYQEMHQAISKILRDHGSEVSDCQAVAVMRVVWEQISDGSVNVNRVRQMLVPPEIQS